MKFLEVENKKVNWKYILIVILLATLAGGFALTCYDRFPTFPEIPLVIKPQPKGWEVFTNEELGFSFKYPAAWGEVKEKFRPGDTGEKYVLYFSNTGVGSGYGNYPYAMGMSEDFVSGMGTWHGEYKGEPNISDAVINTRLWTEGCVIPNYVNIDFNLPGKRIGGVRLFVPILSENDIKKFNAKCPCVPREERQEERQGICIYEDERTCLATYVDTLELFYEMLKNRYTGPSIATEEYLKELKKESLDSISQEKIKIFQEILNSSKIL